MKTGQHHVPPKFGTSGLRGLVTELTPDLVQRHTRAFLRTCDTGAGLFVGRDLRESSDRIAADVTAAARAAGLTVTDCGALPTPALALAAAQADCGAVMITGSHIPANRNGLKFYTRSGEITKADEEAIRAHLGAAPEQGAALGALQTDLQAGQRFADRYLQAFGRTALIGRRIGLYAHSAVGRDLLAGLLADMGAQVVPLGRSDHFIPIDTEALDPNLRAKLRAWVEEFELDALISTDGDSDRPLVIDETGHHVPGDILGQISAEYLQATAVVTPVSSNSGVDQKGFDTVTFTKIGSPYVIAAMQQVSGLVVGYEANGGFLLGFDAQGPEGLLPRLMTRDCVLPIVATLVAAKGGALSAHIAREPAVVTATDRLQDIPVLLSQRLISNLGDTVGHRAAFLERLGEEERALDLTDGLRLHLESGATVHLRPSGNAPEMRVYVEAPDQAQAAALLKSALQEVTTALSSQLAKTSA